jgi:hypothetical protein
MPNLAMREPGHQFSGDGLDLSWPQSGEREIVAWPEEKMTLRIKRRIAEGQIVITNDKPTKSAEGTARTYTLLTGEDARKRMAEPAGPVTRVVYEPAVPGDEQDYQLHVQEVQTQSLRAIEAQEAAAKVAEERHAAIGKAQAEAEKAADAKAKAAAKEEVEPDPLAERLRLTEAANADYLAAKDAAFMEREKARQKLENEWMTSSPAEAAPEPDNSEEDAAFMEREKARQKLEAEGQKERAAETKAVQEAAEKTPSTGYAGKTDPYVEVTGGGRVDPEPRIDAPKAAVKPAAAMPTQAPGKTMAKKTTSK